MQIISNIALISINETAVVQLISFLLFMFIINRVMFRPLLKAMGDRDRYIETAKQDIIASQEKIEDITLQLEERSAAVKDEAFEMNKALEASGGKRADEIIAATKQEIETLKHKAEKEINAQIVEVRKQLKKETDNIGVKIMEQLLKRSLV